jgi:hypothetical protein
MLNDESRIAGTSGANFELISLFRRCVVFDQQHIFFRY